MQWLTGSTDPAAVVARALIVATVFAGGAVLVAACTIAPQPVTLAAPIAIPIPSGSKSTIGMGSTPASSTVGPSPRSPQSPAAASSDGPAGS